MAPVGAWPQPVKPQSSARERIGGVIGALIALPLLSIVRESVLYLRRHLVLEPWDKAPGPLL